jgi:hypothetical protein
MNWKLNSALLVGTIISFFAWEVEAFSLPGLIPKNYRYNDKLDIMAGSLESQKTVVPFFYYTLDFCNNTESVTPNPKKYFYPESDTPL